MIPQAARINEELVRRHEQMMATEFNKQIKQFATGTVPPKPPTLVACKFFCDAAALPCVELCFSRLLEQ